MRPMLTCSVGLAAVATTLTLAACGSSNDAGSTSASAGATGTQSSGASTTAQGGNGRGMMSAKVQSCLKAEGVTLPSRPAGGYGGGGTPPAGASTNGAPNGGPPQGGYGGGGFGGNMSQADRAKMQAAFKKCGVTFGQGAGGGQRPNVNNAAYKAAVTKYTACVRKNGYDLPDPNFSGTGPIFAAKIQKDAKFQAASKQCQSILAGAMGGGTAGQGAPNGQAPATTTTTS